MTAITGTPAQAEQLLATIVNAAQQRWRDRLVASYAMGSLAHGGFSPLVSDIDIGFVLTDPLLGTEGEAVRQLVESIKAGNQPFSDRLSVFWGSVATLSGAAPGGRFPPLDRLDMLKHGRLLAGDDIRENLPYPTHKDLVLVGAEFALWRLANDEATVKLKHPQALARSDPKTLTKLILYPIRFMFTARTGEVGRNEAAVEHFVSTTGGASSKLASLALQWRAVAPEHTDESAVQAIADGVLPLYLEFLLDHERRLREYDRPDLADAFHHWRQRLRA